MRVRSVKNRVKNVIYLLPYGGDSALWGSHVFFLTLSPRPSGGAWGLVSKTRSHDSFPGRCGVHHWNCLGGHLPWFED